MLALMELYEMVSLNEGILSDSERQAMLKARLALGMFERAMHRFRTGTAAGDAGGAAVSVAVAAAGALAARQVEMPQPEA